MKKTPITLILCLIMTTLAPAAPTIDIYCDGALTLVGDPIANTPRISVTIVSSTALTLGRLSVYNLTQNLTFVSSGTSYYATYEVSSPLPNGTQTITVEAFNVSGEATTKEVTPIYVQNSLATTVQGFPLNYPNPFDPGSQSTTIAYTLSKPANITLSVFDLSGNLTARKSYSQDAVGGRAGYNEVTWDGKNDGGACVGNGLYIYLLIADGTVLQNGKGKMTVFKR